MKIQNISALRNSEPDIVFSVRVKTPPGTKAFYALTGLDPWGLAFFFFFFIEFLGPKYITLKIPFPTSASSANSRFWTIAQCV